jgi:hypothetical protein
MPDARCACQSFASDMDERKFLAGLDARAVPTRNRRRRQVLDTRSDRRAPVPTVESATDYTI